MIVLYTLFFACFVTNGFTYVIFPDIIDTAIHRLRTKREASCGGDVDVSSGTAKIQLPTEPYNGSEFYRADENCTWHVRTLPNHYMILKSEYFSLEGTDDCMWDYLEISESKDADVTNRFCGWEPMTYITAGDEFTMRFKSDISYEYEGFSFTLQSKQRDIDASRCDSSIIGGEDSRIMNNDKVGTGCFYRIQAPKDKVIQLELKMLDFGSALCEEESIVVYEGLTTHGDPLGTICSDSVHGVQQYHAPMLFIEYRNPLQQEGERFTIEYSFVEDNFTPAPIPSTTPSPVGGNNDCSGIYKGIDRETGELIYTAPEYKNNKECIIVVRNVMLPGHVVQIEFLYFDIENSDNCVFDSLKILSGERNDSVMLGGPYCGESLDGRTFVTSGNSLRLEFKTDVSFAYRGFQAKISFVPSSVCACGKNQVCVRQSYEKRCIRGSLCVSSCKNGGTCIKTDSTEKCYCRAGFRGDDCAKDDGEQFYHLRFTTAPLDRSLKKGDSQLEECAVDVPSGEQVQYGWTLNGVLVESYNKKTGFGTHPGGVLQIDKFTDHLEGQYSCFASTSAGTAEHTFEYRMVEDCDVRIYPGPQTESKKSNEDALMICHVDSRAKDVRWKKDGVYIDFENNSKYRKMVNNYLSIMDVDLSDTGTYTCEAEDKHGCYSSKEGKLTVIDVKPLNKYCGISIHDEAHQARAKISKGNEARPNENPWHVTFTAKNYGAFCGGTLISQKFVLTAAHCIKEFESNLKLPWAPENVDMLLGTTNCWKRGDETIRRFKSYTVHPDYNKTTLYDSDIALVELDSPVEYSDAIRPICLAPAAYNDKEFLENSHSRVKHGKVTGCGWKYNTQSPSSNLQQVLLPYVFRDECKESHEGTKYNITDRMFCAGSNIVRTGDTCKGDSGGGLVMEALSRWVQTGIVSWGLDGCDSTKYGVYTNVGFFYDWIEGIAKFSEEEGPDFF